MSARPAAGWRRARDLAEEIAEVADQPEEIDVSEIRATVAAGEESGAGAGSASSGSDHAEDGVEACGGGSEVLGAQGEACETVAEDGALGLV